MYSLNLEYCGCAWQTQLKGDIDRIYRESGEKDNQNDGRSEKDLLW